MGADGFGIADALDNSNFPLVVQIFYRRHGRVEANAVVDGQNLFGLNIHRLPVVHV